MSDQDHTRDPLPKVENENIKDHNQDLETGAPPLSVGAPAFSPPAGEGADLQEGADAPETGNLTPETAGGAKLPGLCHHRMESGYYCQSPAVHDRHFCYSHLRLRGQRIRMARAIARRLPYRFDLPALDDLYAVQSAVEHVGRALGAGLMKREEANSLLWMLQQSAINHRNLALARMNAVDPTLSPRDGEKVPALSLSKGGASAFRVTSKVGCPIACPELAEGSRFFCETWDVAVSPTSSMPGTSFNVGAVCWPPCLRQR